MRMTLPARDTSSPLAPSRRSRSRQALLPAVLTVGLGVLTLGGCAPDAKPKKVDPGMTRLELRQVPDFLKGSLLESVDVLNAEPALVNGYGLVVNLDETGDTRAPVGVRQYILEQAQKHGVGSPLSRKFSKVDPQTLLNDRHVAIVRIDALIPPGIRQYQQFDARVSALENSNTSSLSHGVLWEADLSPRGADPFNPGGNSVNPEAVVKGAIFVNPSYAIDDTPSSVDSRLSLRYGLLMGQAIALQDRPIFLRLRQPEARVARLIEERINYRYQSIADVQNRGNKSGYSIAFALNEAEIAVYVPRTLDRQWEHYIGVVSHLYFNATSDFAAIKGAELAAEAVKPDAYLQDISYAWEGLGEAALPQIRPLLTNPSPKVAYAAAQAAAFLGDLSALDVLASMARTPDHPFGLNAVRTLSQLPTSPRVNEALYTLLSSDSALVRIEAYTALSKAQDHRILSRVIETQKGSFVLDIVPTNGPAMVFATRQGPPRIAVIGRSPTVRLPISFLTMSNTFSISTEPDQTDSMSMFYRGFDVRDPVTTVSRPDLAEMIARLGGQGAPGQPKLPFGYSEIVAILSEMSDRKLIYAPSRKGADPVAFVLQDVSASADELLNAPAITEPVRSQDAPESEPSAPGAAGTRGDAGGQSDAGSPSDVGGLRDGDVPSDAGVPRVSTEPGGPASAGGAIGDARGR